MEVFNFYTVAFIVMCLCAGSTTADFMKTLSSLARTVVGLFTDTECTDRWNKPNMTELHHQLSTRLHGQHVVVDTVVRSIHGHLRYGNPEKALVLSFHGLTGCGKNYVSRIIAESLYPSGMNSRHVNLIHAPSSFPHESQLSLYKDQLRDWIRGNASNCERNIFIIDEIEKMPPGLINIIKPFLDHYPQIEGIDYRKNIFLLLSNTGGRDITEFALKQWKMGREREDIKLKELEDILINTAFNEKGGLWHSDLIDHNLISAFIPFLPLERKHVMKCVEDDLRNKHLALSQDMVKSVADDLKYIPEDVKLYSATGCKRVSERVNMLVEHDEL